MRRVKRELILCGFHPSVSPTPIKLCKFTQRAQRERMRHGWTTAVYYEGDTPTGLRLNAAARKEGD